MQAQKENIDNLIKEYSDLFDNYDFYVSRSVPKDAYKAIDIGAGMFIVFTQRGIRETIEDKLREYVKEQNEKINKGEKPFTDIG